MSILADRNTRVLVQGITGNFGRSQTRLMQSYGTRIVAGVTPGRGGTEILGVPVFDSVAEADRTAGPIDSTVLYVPAPYARKAVEEAIESRIPLAVVITEGIPLHDEMHLRYLTLSKNIWMIGPNCPGILVPGETSLGMIPPSSTTPGDIAVISRSGTLTFEVTKVLTDAGLGQSVCVGIGGDRVIGRDFADYLRLAEQDPTTKAIVLVGEIGGDAEERAAQTIAEEIAKPVVGFLVGRHAPKGRRMGHAGAMIAGTTGTIESKERALSAAGVDLVPYLWDLPETVRNVRERALSRAGR